MNRIGIGYDAHRLVEEASHNRRCGNPVPKGAGGHSDADVLVHAVMDALLGAAAMGI